MLIFASVPMMVAQAADAPGWHMESVPAKRIVATDKVTVSYPNRTVSKWSLMAAVPPDLPSQTDVTVEMVVPDDSHPVTLTQEKSGLKRLIRLVSIPVQGNRFDKSIIVVFTYKATLIARRLAKGNPPKPVLPLAAADRTNWLAETPTLDYHSPAFQSWLSANNLRKQEGQQDLQFAYRVYSLIKQKYNYSYVDAQDRKVSNLCQTNLTDCGGSVNLLVGALRANNIPARQLVGRNAVSGTPGEYAGQRHVRSEFFAEGIGWVPVEISSGMSFKDQPDSNYFGYDPGDFLTVHLDTDLLIDYGIDGIQKEQWAQSLRFWLKSTWQGQPSPPIMSGDWKVTSSDLQPL